MGQGKLRVVGRQLFIEASCKSKTPREANVKSRGS